MTAKSERPDRTLEEKLMDAQEALSLAKGKLVESLRQKQTAKLWAAEWRTRIDQLESLIVTIKAQIGNRDVQSSDQVL
jgi:hypothetical protein